MSVSCRDAVLTCPTQMLNSAALDMWLIQPGTVEVITSPPNVFGLLLTLSVVELCVSGDILSAGGPPNGQ